MADSASFTMQEELRASAAEPRTLVSYPASLPVLLTSSEELLDDLQVDQAVGGSVRVRAMFPVKKRRYVVLHMVSDADRVMLTNFYDANRLLTFNFNWPCGYDTGVRVCVFELPPKFSPNSSIVGYNSCEVRLREV